MTSAFTALDVEKLYKTTQALGGVSLSVKPGELFGLLGPNGAGKSTLVKIGCGLVSATRGRTEIFGLDPRSTEARKRFGYLAELFRFPGWLTADEVLELHQQLINSQGGKNERAELLELVGLPQVASRRVETMSKGMQQRLGLAQAMIGSPPLLILDEPTSALDPAGRHAVRAMLEELQSRNIAVLLNSHLLSEVELVCDRVAILLDGQIVAEGTPRELAGQDGVQVETENGVRRYPNLSRDQIPGVVEDLMQKGERIFGVNTMRKTLEEVYLEAVRGRMG